MLKHASAVSIAALFFASPVLATDLKDTGLKDPFAASVNHVDFQGFYVGLGAGGEFANTELGSGFIDGIGSDGLVGDAILGYDFRAGSFVFGPRVQFGISNVNTTVMGNDLVNLDYYLNAGARAGIVFNRTLVYVHGGYEMMFLSSDIPSFDQWLEDADTNAFTIGAGIETAIASHVSLAGEVAYVYGVDDTEGTEAFRGLLRLNWRQ